MKSTLRPVTTLFSSIVVALAHRLPSINNSTTLNVGVLIMNGVFISEATIPFDVYYHVGSRMNTFFVAETADPIIVAEGTMLKPHYSFDNTPPIDILVVPGDRGSASLRGAMVAQNASVDETLSTSPAEYYSSRKTLVQWVKTTAASAKVVTSHGWGAFTLAAAGILDGLMVTTFPGSTDELKAFFPHIGTTVADQRFYVDDNVVTSNGGLAAFEACLYIVRHIYGNAEANAVGITGLVCSSLNIGHSVLQYYEPSPPASALSPQSVAHKAVGILLLDGMFITEPVGPFSVYVRGNRNMSVFFVSNDMTPKRTHDGATLYPDFTFADSPNVDILVVTSGIGSHWSFLVSFYGGAKGSDGVIRGVTTTGVSVPYYGNMTEVIKYVNGVSKTAQYVTSHCWGSFTLADAGVLDGRQVTTFPGYGKALQMYYPRIAQVHDGTYRIVQDGNIITSNGGAVAYEASDYVIRLLYGENQAQVVATALVFSSDNYNSNTLVVNRSFKDSLALRGASTLSFALALAALGLAEHCVLVKFHDFFF